MPPKAFSLAGYVDILRLYEEDYHASKKGAKRDAVVVKIMEEITSEEGCEFEAPSKSLKQVSLKFH